LYCGGCGRVRFFLGPFAGFLARITALARFLVTIVPLIISADPPAAHIGPDRDRGNGERP